MALPLIALAICVAPPALAGTVEVPADVARAREVAIPAERTVEVPADVARTAEKAIYLGDNEALLLSTMEVIVIVWPREGLAAGDVVIVWPRSVWDDNEVRVWDDNEG